MRRLHFFITMLFILLLPIAATQELGPLYIELDTVSGQQMLDLDALDTQVPQQAAPIVLEYGVAPGFDQDNDGVEQKSGVVDLQARAAAGSGPACVRWEIYAIESGSSSQLCHGSDACCAALKLVPSRYNWDDPLFLTYGARGATEHNIVSAQGVEMRGSQLSFSAWENLDVVFNDGQVAQSIVQQVSILKAGHPGIRDVRVLDEGGNALQSVVGDSRVSVEIVLGGGSGLGALSVGPRPRILIENVVGESVVQDLQALDVATENKPLESQLRKAGMGAARVISVENAQLLGQYSGKVVFPNDAEFSKVLHCSSDEAGSCETLPSCLAEKRQCYEETAAEVSVYVDHFSSIILAVENETIHLNITSPDNSSLLASGESVHLNVTANISIVLEYSLDEGPVFSLGESTSFSTMLNGSLSRGSLGNGAHALRFGILTALGANSTLEYEFTVDDATPPTISLNMSNNSAHSATYSFLHLRVESSEHGNMSYSLNGQQATATLDGNRSTVLLLDADTGSNVLAMNVSDLQGNVRSALYAFTFTELGSCSDGIQNGAELGVDCGGSCTQCIPLNVSVDRNAYNISDTAYITVIARAYSIANVTVKKDGQVSWRHEFKPAFSGIPVAETRVLGNTSAAGNYTINATMYYLNISEYKSTAFEVVSPYQSPLAVSISANATTINENGEVRFSSSVLGNATSVSYKWDFQNNGVTDSILPNITWRFPDNGTFIVNLTVSDSTGNQTDVETIVVRKLYNLTIRARDNSSGANIQGALVEIENIVANTSSEGVAMFTLPAGEYDVEVSHDAYHDFSEEVELKANREYHANLTAADLLPPMITLISPENNATAYNTSVEFVYAVFDASPVTCVLYTRTISLLWKTTASVTIPSPAGQQSFFLTLDQSGYEWKVECRDRDGNYNSTPPFFLLINPDLRPNELSVDLEQQDVDTAQLEAIIAQAIEDLKGLNGRENEIAEAIQLRKNLEKALINVKRANRDLHSLEWRRLNATELERETQAILDRIRAIKKTTPKRFALLESSEFVNYASRQDVEEVVQLLADGANLKLSKKELGKLVEENDRLQSLLTITTKVGRIELEYIDGASGKATIVQRKVTTKTEDFAPYVFYEMIPKEVAKTTDDVEFFSEHEVIQKDPVVSIDLAKTRDYAYLIGDDVPLQRTQSIAAVLAYRQLEVKKVNLITGLSIFGGISRGIRDTVDIRLIVEVIIIAILVVVYLIYSFGSVEELRRRFEPKGLREFRERVQQATAEAESGNYDGAATRYRDVVAAYRTLHPERRKELNTMVTALLNQVNVLYINKLLGEADMAMGRKDRKEMAATYQKIRALYGIISKEYKAQVWQKCMELHRQLSSK